MIRVEVINDGKAIVVWISVLQYINYSSNLKKNECSRFNSSLLKLMRWWNDDQRLFITFSTVLKQTTFVLIISLKVYRENRVKDNGMQLSTFVYYLFEHS